MIPREKKRDLSEDEAWQIALEDHPEWHKALLEDELPDEVIGENGQPMNVTLHLTLHAMIERQLAADDPEGVVAVARELKQLGLSRHDIRHAIGSVLIQHIWSIWRNRQTFDPARYLAELSDIVETCREA
ncbi:MAG: DUF1841 family protein [Planctomycetes bacterium]|nr:DUF1841 family protein [Planctomycetota bacterium]